MTLPIAVNAALIIANMAIAAMQEFEGPRLDDLSITTADYGTPMNYVYGVRRLDGVSCIWAEPLREVKRRRKTKGGKYNDYSYYGTWAVAICDHEIAKVLRIWFDRNLVYDSTGAGPPSAIEDGGGLVTEAVAGAVAGLGAGEISQYMTVYLGTDDQEPDPRMAATVDAEFGEGSTPAYRGVAYIVFKDLPLEKLGNRLPQVSVEVATAKTDQYPYEVKDAVDGVLLNGNGLAWSPDGARMYYGFDFGEGYDIWDVRARAHMTGGAVADTPDPDGVGDAMPPGSTQRTIGVDSTGDVWMVTGSSAFWGAAWLLRCPPDIGSGGSIMNYLHPVTGLPVPFLDIDHCFSVTWNPDGPTGAAENNRDVVIAVPTSVNVGAWWWQTGATFAYPMGGDLNPEAGGQWRPCFGFPDLDGNVWVMGGGPVGGAYDANQIVFKRILGSGAGPAPSSFAVTLPTDIFGPAAVDAVGFHYRNEALGLDRFIVAYHADPGGERLASIDLATQTVVQTVEAETFTQRLAFHSMKNVRPGQASFWLGMTEYASADLSVIREVAVNDWTEDLIVSQSVYDPTLNALMVEVAGDGFAWLYLDRAEGDGVTLRSIVEDVCERSNLVASTDFDASDLTQTVPGYSWTQGAGKMILGPLLEAYDSEARPHDWQIEFLRRGVAVGAAIPVTQMGAGGSLRFSITTIPDTDLPLKVNLTFADLDRDQQANTAIGQRAGEAVDSRRELSLDASTLALDADTARPMADGYLRREWIRAQTIETTLTRAYTALEPGDAHYLVCDDVTISAKLVRLEFGANGVLTTQWERYAPSVHVAGELAGAPADGMPPDEIAVFGHTNGLALDIPLVTDAHDAAQPFVYLAAAPYGDVAWSGAIFYRSDDGVDYDEDLGSVETSEQATMGYAMSALPDALATCWDNASVVTVKLHSGELTSSTKALVGNGSNRALLGDEIIGFTTATLIAEDTYQLSGLIRGRRGTEWAAGTHAANERFVLLDSLPRATIESSDVDTDVYVRPTTNGGPNGFAQHLDNYTGAALKPYAPAHLAVEEDGGDLVATWTRRTRIGGTWTDYQDVPLGEGSEAYIARILDADGGIIRTFTGLTSPTFTYTAAQQASDGSPAGVSVAVAQVSATVGNGFFAEAALP